MTVREFVQSNCNRPGEPYLEFVISGQRSHTVIGSYVQWKSTPDHLQELLEALGGYEHSHLIPHNMQTGGLSSSSLFPRIMLSTGTPISLLIA